MLKRMTAALIDFLLGIIPLFIVCTMMLGKVTCQNMNPQVVPIVAFQLVLSPLGIILHAIKYPQALGINLGQLYFSLLNVFIIEVVSYSIFELSPIKRTIGKLLMHLEYEHKLNLWCALLRNAVKILTRYLLGIPLIFIFFSKKRQTLHDVITQNSVINSA